MADSKPKLLLLYARPGSEKRSQKIKGDAELNGWRVLREEPSTMLQLHLALIHKSEEDVDWVDVSKQLLRKNPKLTVIAFSGADQRECALQKINDQTVLSLGTELLLENLNDILDYCKGHLSKGISIGALYDVVRNIPWCYEYFLELTLRLLSFNAEKLFVVKKIVGIDENGEMIEGEYEKRTILSPSEIELFVRIKLAVLQLLEEQDKFVPAEADSESCDPYGEIHNLLYDLAQPQRKLLRNRIDR